MPRIGHQGARIGDRAGSRKPMTESRRIDGGAGLPERQSANILAIDDRPMVQALRFVGDNRCLTLRVANLAEGQRWTRSCDAVWSRSPACLLRPASRFGRSRQSAGLRSTRTSRGSSRRKPP